MVGVTIQLLQALAIIASHVQNQSQKDLLLHHAEMIKKGSDEALSEESDRQDIQKHYFKILEKL
ncbi:hypothetical protein [Planktothrix mougeotii]|uniref:hypothetical protein n=1 Tax=Planktothrix mougeotii TaxID=54306 RepID=UPI001D1489B9|nr:hypothetical protein [Planktothrix mougeotii]